MKNKIIKDEITGRPIRIDVTPEDIMTMPIKNISELMQNLNLLPQGATEYIQKRLDIEFSKSKTELRDFVRSRIESLPMELIGAREKVEDHLKIKHLFESDHAFCAAYALVEICDSIKRNLLDDDDNEDEDDDYITDLAIFKGQIKSAIEGFIKDKIPEL